MPADRTAAAGPVTAVPPAPFGHLRPTFAVAAAFLGASALWVVAGGSLPGGRWLAVHLFTVGVVTPLIAGLTAHFAQTILHAPDEAVRSARTALLAGGALALVAGRAADATAIFALGGTLVLAAVVWLWWDLRRLRRRAVSGRFAFVVRAYERACGALAHGALLGIALGTGLLGGSWWGAARLAHLHAVVLGWGGLTLLATLVFFGPTILRVRMHPRAADAAVPALRRGATALSVATLALLLSGAGGAVGTGARLLAAGGLAGYAIAATVICRHVLLAGRAAKPGLAAWMVQASCAWLVVGVWLDVAVIASGRLELLDALGAVVLAGVLAQAILGAAGYLTPMLLRGGPAVRARARTRLDRLPRLRAVALNAGVAAAAVGAVVGPTGATAARTGWMLVAAAATAQLAIAAASLVPEVSGRWARRAFGLPEHPAGMPSDRSAP